MNRYLLVMTACIDPSAGAVKLERTDPAIRLRDYEAALRFWLQYRDPRIRKILFIENSGYSLDTLEAIAKSEPAKQVEFVSLNCNYYPEKNHYGYAEMLMLDRGLSQSKLRSETTHMIKVTGRLLFPDLSRLLDRVPEEAEYVVDVRHWKTPWQRHREPFVTSQLMIFAHEYYREHLQQSYEEMAQTSLWIESFLYSKLYTKQKNPKRLLRFPVSADPSGHPAHRAEAYDSPRQRRINRMRAAARVAVPFWWL